MAPILEKYALDRELRRFLCPRAIYIFWTSNVGHLLTKEKRQGDRERELEKTA